METKFFFSLELLEICFDLVIFFSSIIDGPLKLFSAPISVFDTNQHDENRLQIQDEKWE